VEAAPVGTVGRVRIVLVVERLRGRVPQGARPFRLLRLPGSGSRTVNPFHHSAPFHENDSLETFGLLRVVFDTMSRETENPTEPKREAPTPHPADGFRDDEQPPKREAPTPHPAEAVEACFRDDDCQRPFIDRARLVESAKKWAELREIVNAIILENSFYRREMNAVRDENSGLRRLLAAAEQIVNEITLENSLYRGEMNAIRDENSDLRRLLAAAEQNGGWERAAENYRCYEQAMKERDEARAKLAALEREAAKG